MVERAYTCRPLAFQTLETSTFGLEREQLVILGTCLYSWIRWRRALVCSFFSHIAFFMRFLRRTNQCSHRRNLSCKIWCLGCCRIHDLNVMMRHMMPIPVKRTFSMSRETGHFVYEFTRVLMLSPGSVDVPHIYLEREAPRWWSS